MSLLDATIAANRFGLGARLGDLARIAGDPRGWLRTQCLAGHSQSRDFENSVDSRGIHAMAFKKNAAWEFYREHSGRRLLAAVNSETPFVERLVWFWSNHFTVSIQNKAVIPYAEAFEREAIRPHVLGKFIDMLSAAIGHPAMQIYLDNHVSNGPHSFNRGNLNENLAREILELHTLGVDGGYTPRDIREFALMLTGWGVDGPAPLEGKAVTFNPNRHARGSPPPNSPAFAFDPDRHEPGPKWFLGKTYKGAGVQEVERALREIAEHPSTPGFVAVKLARHFISDDPPAAAVARLEDVFRRSGGDLREVALALIEEPEVWKYYSSKVKTPAELVISAARATEFHEGRAKPLYEAMERLGQLPFDANSPAGFPDRGEEWMGGQAVLERVDFCADAAAYDARSIHPTKFARQILGSGASDAAMLSIARAPSRSYAIGLTLASREFQRR